MSEDVSYQKIWLELQALAWNNADICASAWRRVNAEWRAVLTEAFDEPRRELGIELPLEALVSLVMTFNQGIILERLGGIETGHRELLRLDRPVDIADDPTRRRASRRGPATPTSRLRRARRRAALLRGLRLRRADDPAAADLVDHPLAALEDADPLPGAALPRGHLRRARQRPLGPPAEPAAYAEREFAADALAVLDATGDRARGARRRSRWARSGRCCSPPSTPSGSPAPVFIAPALSRSASAAASAGVTRSTTSCDTDEGWAKYNRHYWLRDYRGFLEFFFSQMFTEPHSTKQIEDCVGWGLETTPETLVATELGAQSSTRRRRASCARRIRCPVLVIHGDDDAITGRTAAGVALAEATGGDAGHARGRRATARRRATRSRSTCCCATSSPRAPRARALGARPSAPQARALHLLADRPRPRPARRRDRRRAAQAASRPRDRLARPAPGHHGARGARRAHPPGERATWPASPATSSRESAEHDLHCFQALAADGRDPARQLHGLPRRRPRGATTTCGSATRPGSSTTTCTRTRSRSAPPTSG